MGASGRSRARVFGVGLIAAGFALMVMAPVALAADGGGTADDDDVECPDYGSGDDCASTTSAPDDPDDDDPDDDDSEEPGGGGDDGTDGGDDTTDTTVCEYGSGDCPVLGPVEDTPDQTVVAVDVSGAPTGQESAGGATLPRTGSSAWPLGLAGFGALVAGVALLALVRPREARAG